MFRIVAATCFLAASLLACTASERSFEQIQFCLVGQNSAEALKRVLRGIATEEGMSFGDRSQDAEAELKSIYADNMEAVPAGARAFPLINVRIWNSEFEVGGGNLGLGADQITLGFGPDTAAGRAFAERTIQRLNAHWRVKRLARGESALPMDCATVPGNRRP